MCSCPVCNTQHNVANRVTGDWIYCTGCEEYLYVRHNADGTSELITISGR